ncbi:MAG: rod shape-determining protein MreC [bacterium]|nr:rod shape-determining protein MreC [bacterium]
MNSYRQNKRPYRRLFAATILVVVLFIADIVSGGTLRYTLRSGVATFSSWVGSATGILGANEIFSSRRALESQNRSLSDTLAQLEDRAAGFDAIRVENEELRALLQVVQATSQKSVTAPVVSSIRSSPYGTFLIGAGSADGITRGSLVQTSGGFVVGKVSDMGAHTATVTEVFAPGVSLDAILGTAAISVRGSGGGNARAEAPRGLSIALGSPVFAPEFGQRAIGIVGAVASSSGSAVQDVFIRLPVNLASLKFVYVIKN